MPDVHNPSPETLSWLWAFAEYAAPFLSSVIPAGIAAVYAEWKINRDRDEKRTNTQKQLELNRATDAAMIESIKDVQLHQQDEITDLKLLAPKVIAMEIQTSHLARRLDVLQDDVKDIRLRMDKVATKDDMSKIEADISELRADMRHMLFTLARTPIPTGSP